MLLLLLFLCVCFCCCCCCCCSFVCFVVVVVVVVDLGGNYSTISVQYNNTLLILKKEIRLYAFAK